MINTVSMHFFRGICKTSDDRTYKEIENIIPALATAYLDMFEKAKKCKEREFFGLRDFYRFDNLQTGSS